MTTLEKLEDLIYNGFKETDRRFQEQQEKSDREFRERQEKSDREFQELREMQKSILRRMEQSDKRHDLWQKRMEQSDKRFEKSDEKWKSLLDDFKGFTDSVGLFAESMVKPAVGKLMAKRGIKLTHFSSRAESQRNGGMEWDVLASGPSHVVAVEVKLRLRRDHIDDTLDRLGRFFDFFERYKGLILHGAVSGMSIDQGVDRYAYKKGLFVLAQSGENIHLLNDRKFQPKAFY